MSSCLVPGAGTITAGNSDPESRSAIKRGIGLVGLYMKDVLTAESSVVSRIGLSGISKEGPRCQSIRNTNN